MTLPLDKTIREKPGPPAERRLFLAALAAVLAVTVYIRQTVDPLARVTWSYQVLGLCLVLVVIAGRALLGRSEASKSDVRWPLAAIWIGLVLAAVLPYLASLRAGLLSDDFGLVFAMSKVNGPLQAVQDTAYRGLFRPVSLLIYWAGVHLWHGSGLGYHAVSIALNVAAALLVFALGRRWIGNTYAAAIAAALFAVHPLHVEAVVWIPSHADLLYTVFGLASLLCLEGYLTAPPPRRWFALAGATLFFAAALFGKEAAIALPAIALLRLALLPRKASRGQALIVLLAYALPVLPYLRAYTATVGATRGYQIPLTFWNTAFPSAPLIMMGDFLFPIQRQLLAQVPSPLWWLALLAMAAGVFWLARSLDLIPARRLWFWVGFLVISSIPVWVYSADSSSILESSRRAYFPTIALAWLFGDVCAARGLSLRRSGAVAAAAIILFGLLTPWYIQPWLRAGRLAQQVLSAGVTFVQDHPDASTLYVRGLPEMAYGAPVFRNCFPQAMNLALARTVPVRVVTDTHSPGSIHPDTMARWVLRPGEFFITWDPKTGRMQVVRAGPQPSPDGGPAAGGPSSEREQPGLSRTPSPRGNDGHRQPSQ